MGAELIAPFAMWGSLVALVLIAGWYILRSQRKRGRSEAERDLSQAEVDGALDALARRRKTRPSRRRFRDFARGRVPDQDAD